MDADPEANLVAVTTPPPDDETLRELGEVADALLQQASALRERWEELGDALGVDLGVAAAPAVAADVDDRAVSPAEPPARQVAEDDPAAEVAMRPDYGTESPDPVRVLVFDLMLSGRSRKEVKSHVRSSFGSGTDLTVVDELFDSR